MYNRRKFLTGLSTAGLALMTVPWQLCGREELKTKSSLNILFFTADDLNQDSLGCYGSTVPDISPNLDKFAAQSMRFKHAHVTVAICQPSRGVLATGRYPHNSGIMGFMHTKKDIPTAMGTFQKAGYLTGILGKVGHSTPKTDFAWDFAHDQKELGNGRSPIKYYDYCKEFLSRCSTEGKSFYFMVNSHDPHRPYHIPDKPSKKNTGAEEPSSIYKPEEITVPGFLPNLEGVREEVSYYFNSVKRLDDTFGKVMQALKESGFEKNTLVMFLSDNGVALPFAKCNAYLASTRTPWIVRWPGFVKQGMVDEKHFISGIDFFPTILEAAGIAPYEGLDGKSFIPLLKGEKQKNRNRVFTQIDCKAGGDAVPMRCVQNKKFGYIFNSWADSEHYYKNNNEGATMKAMVAAAEDNPQIAERIRMFRYREVEELYDLEKDPDCLHNLIDNPEYKQQLESMRSQLTEWMKQTNDPLIKAFNTRNSPKEMEDIMLEAYAPYKKAKKNKNKKDKKNKKRKNKK